MLISIIVTCYNQKSYIKKTLDSLIAQTYHNWEILIGDDSPNDECWNIICDFVKKYPDKIRARHNIPSKGIVGNMRFLLSNISKKSDYVAFLEGDDLYTPDNLSKKIEIFKQYPDVKLVYNECSTIDKSGNIIVNKILNYTGCRYYYNNEKIELDYMLCGLTPIYHSWSSLMCSIDCIKKYDISIPTLSDRNLISDFIFFTNVGTNENIYGLNSPLTLYRVHDSNVSTSTNNTLCNDLIEFGNYLYQQKLIGKKILSKVKAKSYITMFFSFLKKSISSLFMGIRENLLYSIKVFFLKIYGAIKFLIIENFKGIF